MKITARQRQIVKLLCQDMTQKAVGIELGISTRTVEFHLQKIYQKVGVMGSCGLTKWALRNDLTTL